jgi:hypothetical protein
VLVTIDDINDDWQKFHSKTEQRTRKYNRNPHVT